MFVWLFGCLFVWLVGWVVGVGWGFGFFVLLENFSLISKHHHYWWKAAFFFYLCMALLVIEQWGFLSVLHRVWHNQTVFIGHLWAPVTLIPVTKRSLAVTTCFNDLGLSRMGFEHPTSACEAKHSKQLRHRSDLNKMIVHLIIVQHIMNMQTMTFFCNPRCSNLNVYYRCKIEIFLIVTCRIKKLFRRFKIQVSSNANFIIHVY